MLLFYKLKDFHDCLFVLPISKSLWLFFTWVDALYHLHARLSIGQCVTLSSLGLSSCTVDAVRRRARQVHRVRRVRAAQHGSSLLRLLWLLIWRRRWGRARVYRLPSSQVPLTPMMVPPLLLPAVPLLTEVPLLPLPLPPTAGLATRAGLEEFRGRGQLARGSTVRRPWEGIASKGSVAGPEPPPLLLDHVLAAVVGVGAAHVATLLALLPVPRPGGRHLRLDEGRMGTIQAGRAWPGHRLPRPSN